MVPQQPTHDVAPRPPYSGAAAFVTKDLPLSQFLWFRGHRCEVQAQNGRCTFHFPDSASLRADVNEFASAGQWEAYEMARLELRAAMDEAKGIARR